MNGIWCCIINNFFIMENEGSILYSTPNIHLGYDGRSVWFTCEEVIDDWVKNNGY